MNRAKPLSRKTALKAKKGLTRSGALARRTPMPKATSDLRRRVAMKKRNSALERSRRTFKAAVFERYGDVCVFCGLPGAVDPAHIIPTNLLGALRHADVRLARPAHRTCHREQHDGKRRFPADVIVDAYAAHNALNPVVRLYPKDDAA